MQISFLLVHFCPLLALSGLGVDGHAAPTPRQQYQAVLDDFEVKRRAFAAKLEAATTDEERQTIRRQLPSAQDYYGRLLAVAEAYPEDDAAVDALTWIVATSVNGYDDFKERGARIKRAMDILARDHLNDPRVGRVCLKLVSGPAPLRDEFLHTVYAKSTDRGIQGRTCLALGEFLIAKSETVAQLRGPSGRDTMKQVRAEAPHRLKYYELLLQDEPHELTSTGERLLERVIDDYGDLAYDPYLLPPGEKTLAEVAREDLRRLRHLAVGEEAPEIDGKDIDGKRFRLSDYRGRVVLLTFSGNWCGPCRAMYPRERALVERFKSRPFVMLSVNTDQDQEVLRKSIAEREITWRCWWEAGIDGPICTQWMIEEFPQVYVIDHTGVIRAHVLPSDMDNTIEELLRVCEAELSSVK